LHGGSPVVIVDEERGSSLGYSRIIVDRSCELRLRPVGVRARSSELARIRARKSCTELSSSG